MLPCVSCADVAVTGIPEPQQFHASIMVKFARDVLDRLPVLLQGLVESLGEDTLDLGMRVGLHSGNTTAGVLRGEKGRFQVRPFGTRQWPACFRVAPVLQLPLL